MKEDINVDDILTKNIGTWNYHLYEGTNGTSINTERIKLAVKEIAEKLLEQAAENAEIIKEDTLLEDGSSWGEEVVSKSSITNTIKQLKL